MRHAPFSFLDAATHPLSHPPAALSSLLQVDDAGKITRLRKECPHEECGAGVFMANHADRYYCGKCHLTFAFSEA